MGHITENPHELYRFLIKSIRDQDGDQQVILRFLTQPQVLFDDWYNYAAEKLRNLVDPEKAQLRDSPGGYLPYLAWLVGYDPSFFELTRRLFGPNGTSLDDVMDDFWVPAYIQPGAISTSATLSLEFLTYLSIHSPAILKKLIILGVPLWKGKGISKGVRNIATLMTGQEPFIRNWFYHRFILEESAFGDYDFFMDSTPGVGADSPEYQVDIRVEKPDTAEEVILILMLFAHHRAVSERYNVAFVDFLDNFLDGVINRWKVTDIGVGDGTVTEGSNVLNGITLVKRDSIRILSAIGGGGSYPNDGTQITTDHPLDSGWVANRTIIFRASFKESTAGLSSGFLVRNGKGAANTAEVYFKYVPSDGLDGPATVEITKAPSTVITSLTTPFNLVHSVDYVFRVDFVINADGSGFVRVYIDGDYVGSCPNQTPGTWANEGSSTLTIFDSTSGSELVVDDIEIFQHPLTVVRVGLQN